MTELGPLGRLNPAFFETPAILKKTATASRQLAELKGLAASMPNQGILINTLSLQEAKDSSAIENIVTTHDELFRGQAFPDLLEKPGAKEVRNYVQALRIGYRLVRKTELLTANNIIEIQAERQNSTLRITVRDNGPGLPDHRTSENMFKKGLGLANTEKRLEQLYGAAHLFELSDHPEGGLIVTLEIPFHKDGSAGNTEVV